jgi:hypothetical protein
MIAGLLVYAGLLFVAWSIVYVGSGETPEPKDDEGQE